MNAGVGLSVLWLSVCQRLVSVVFLFFSLSVYLSLFFSLLLIEPFVHMSVFVRGQE